MISCPGISTICSPSTRFEKEEAKIHFVECIPWAENALTILPMMLII